MVSSVTLVLTIELPSPTTNCESSVIARLKTACGRERERERERRKFLGELVSDTTVLKGGVIET
jgi:hypothetical protein